MLICAPPLIGGVSHPAPCSIYIFTWTGDVDVEASTDLCVRILETWTAGWVHGMLEATTKEHLTSQNGKYSTPSVASAMAGDMSGMERVSDDAEQYPGVLKMNEAIY